MSFPKRQLQETMILGAELHISTALHSTNLLRFRISLWGVWRSTEMCRMKRRLQR